jgi:hypothetical protein
MKKILLFILVSFAMVSCDLTIEVPDKPNGTYYPPTYNYNQLGCECGEILSINYVQNAGNIAEVELQNACTQNIMTFQLSTAVLGNQSTPGCNGYVCLNTMW